jgi:hypothetical protein
MAGRRGAAIHRARSLELHDRANYAETLLVGDSSRPHERASYVET